MEHNKINELPEEEREEMDEEFKELQQDLQDKMMEKLKKSIRPEFLNRVDDVIVFHPFTQDHIREIVSIQLNRVHKMLSVSYFSNLEIIYKELYRF